MFGLVQVKALEDFLEKEASFAKDVRKAEKFLKSLQ